MIRRGPAASRTDRSFAAAGKRSALPEMEPLLAGKQIHSFRLKEHTMTRKSLSLSIASLFACALLASPVRSLADTYDFVKSTGTISEDGVNAISVSISGIEDDSTNPLTWGGTI